MANTIEPQNQLGTREQFDSDQQHLKLLSIFYFIVAVFTIMGALGMILMHGIFAAIIDQALAQAAEENNNSAVDPEIVEFIKTIVFAVLIGVGVLTLIKGLLQAFTGWKLAQRKGRTLCFIVAILTVIDIPLGTALGIFTFVVLARPTVKSQFAGKPLDEIYADGQAKSQPYS